jgi:type I restriction enzyme S subunit
MKEGWDIKKLGEVAKVSSGNSAPQKKELFEDGSFPFIRTSDVGQIRKGFISSCVDYLNKDGIKGLKLHKKGTILFPKSGASTFLNHRVMMEIDSYVSSHLATIKGNSSFIDDRFLLYFLTTIDARDLMQDIAYPSLKTSDISLIPISLPPLPEQQRIVSILDDAFAAIAKAKANAEQNLKNAKELFESYLQGVFENGKLKVENGEWIEKKLIEITNKIGSGATPRGGNESYKTVGISLVRSMNVHDFQFKEKNLAFIDEQQAKELNNVTLHENDVLLNITGASVARCCVIPKEYLPARVNQHVSIIRANNEIIDPIFLNLLLTSKYYKDQLLFTGEQGATRQAITKAQLEVFAISFPKSLKEQQTIVQKLDALSAETKKLEAIYQQKINDLEELKKSVLQKAFCGELKTNKMLEV